MNQLIIKKIKLLLLFLIILGGNACTPFLCELSNDDYNYILNEDSLFYLENDYDTIILYPNVRTGIKDDGTTFGIPDFNRNEFISSYLLLDSARYYVGVKKYACIDMLDFYVVCNDCLSESHLIYMSVDLQEEISTPIDVLGNTYNSYFLIDADTTQHVKSIIYSREFGFLKVELYDDYKIELFTVQ